MYNRCGLIEKMNYPVLFVRENEEGRRGWQWTPELGGHSEIVPEQPSCWACETKGCPQGKEATRSRRGEQTVTRREGQASVRSRELCPSQVSGRPEAIRCLTLEFSQSSLSLRKPANIREERSHPVLLAVASSPTLWGWSGVIPASPLPTLFVFL